MSGGCATPSTMNEEERKKTEPSHLLRGSLATPPHAAQHLSCVPQALRTPPPSLLPQRSAQAPFRLPHSSQIHRKGRRRDRPRGSRPRWRGGGGAGLLGGMISVTF